MKHFLGVKVVQAEPMAKDGVDGYKVVYKDGYVSWSPKEIFDSSHLELPDLTNVPSHLHPVFCDWAVMNHRKERLKSDISRNYDDEHHLWLGPQLKETEQLIQGALLVQVLFISDMYLPEFAKEVRAKYPEAAEV